MDKWSSDNWTLDTKLWTNGPLTNGLGTIGHWTIWTIESLDNWTLDIWTIESLDNCTLVIWTLYNGTLHNWTIVLYTIGHWTIGHLMNELWTIGSRLLDH